MQDDDDDDDDNIEITAAKPNRSLVCFLFLLRFRFANSPTYPEAS